MDGRLVATVLVALSACGRIGFNAPGSGSSDLPDTGSAALTCPDSYLPVDPVAGFTTSGFCVAKYEMREMPGAVSIPTGKPWILVDLPSAIAACQAIGPGFDLITDEQWQTLARQIADEPWNWSSGVAYMGRLSVGHSDAAPNTQIAASTDDDPCAGTGQTCSLTVWNSQRRTHRLPNGNYIWDLGGDSVEWVKDNVTQLPSGDDYVATLSGTDGRIAAMGTPRLCDAPSTPPYCGYGIIHSTTVGGAIVRGGGLDWGIDAGIFTGGTGWGPPDTDWDIGFRCVYVP